MPRTRTKQLFEPSVATGVINRTWRGFNTPEWIVYPPEYANTPGPSASVTMIDYVSPDYYRQSAKGFIVNNPLTKLTVEELPPQPTSFTRTETFHNDRSNPQNDYEVGWKNAGTLIPFGGLSSAPAFLGATESIDDLVTKASELAVTKAHANIDTSAMLALATAGEARETVSFLRSSMERSVRILRQMRKVDVKRLRREISRKEHKERYMELRYAIRPLIYDVQGAVKVLYAPKGHYRQTFRAKEERSASNEDQLNGVLVIPGLIADIIRKYHVDVVARAGVLTDVQHSLLATLGGERLAESAYELLPGSFIADWFANIGSTIGAWSPKAGVTPLASWVVVTKTVTVTNEAVNARPQTTNTANTWENSASLGTCRWFNTTTLVSRTPSPVLRVLPQFDLNLDTYKLTDLSIILRNIFRK